MVFLVMSAFVAVLVQQYRIQIQKRADREKHKEQLACTMAFVLLQLAQERRGKSDFDEKKYLEQEAQQENRLVDRYFCERLAKIWTPQVDIKEVRVMFGIRLRIDLPTFLEFCQTHALYMKESRYESLKEKQREKAEWIQYVESKIKNNQTRKFLIYADAALVLALTVLVSFDSFSIGAAIALFSFQIVSFSGLFMLEFVSHEPADWRSVYDIVLIVCTILVASIGAASSSSKILHVGFSFPILRLITVQDRIRNFEDGDEASNPPAKGDNFQLVRTFAPFLMHLLVLLMIVVTSFSFLFTMVFPNAEDDTLSLQTQPFRTTTNSLMSGFQILTTSNWHCKAFFSILLSPIYVTDQNFSVDVSSDASLWTNCIMGVLRYVLCSGFCAGEYCGGHLRGCSAGELEEDQTYQAEFSCASNVLSRCEPCECVEPVPRSFR
eukprot:TRINITY_DN39647_c0_g3_i1.p1 TRINITY_DN39647_c0_g3~~TRINITY_DN39647_c0_g3_i1.p1  ORF type:complete len:437 (-),score=105.73 TRINITY_DN39647_c0_g3_i1:194-1504(-)